MPQLSEPVVDRPFKVQSYSTYRKSHFAPAFLFLSGERRKALQTLYAVCRILDDAVDVHHDDPDGFLSAWKNVFEKKDASYAEPIGQESLAKDFVNVMKTFDIPSFVMVDLIEKGVSVDLHTNRFQTPLDTEGYCYGVAGTVGLACLPIFGVPFDEAKDYAVRLGITVQWINTIRDVGVDAKLNRIYLPLDHLNQFGYTEEDLMRRKVNAPFYSLMNYEAQTARSHFKRAQELLPRRWKKALLPARIMGRIYLSLLDKLEQRKFPTFKEKVKLGLIQKGISIYKEITA